MTALELLVGASDFWKRAAGDIAGARRRVYVQAMSFEGDAAGGPVGAAIATAMATDRRVLIDSYSRHVINDRFVHAPAALIDRRLRAERRATGAMWSAMVAAGARVRLTNPVGALFWRYAARNHKKLIVADDVAYIGGINFSDHNFAWSDFMLRIQGAEAADRLARDFEATFAGAPRPWRARLGEVDLISLDGRSNASGFAPIFDLIGAARREIAVISPYLTFPFTDALAGAARRGVAVRLVTPRASNKPMVRDALLVTAARAGFEVRLLPAMTHLKAMLIDGERLVVGSSNFDFVSLAAEEELMAILTAPAVIADFRRRILGPALAAALPAGAWRPSPAAGFVSGLVLWAADRTVRATGPARRNAVDWRG